MEVYEYSEDIFEMLMYSIYSLNESLYEIGIWWYKIGDSIVYV